MYNSSNVSRSARHVRSWAALPIVALLAASSWLVLRADIPQVASGTWMTAGEVGTIPAGAASVSLPDGRVLVAGGGSDGTPSSGVFTFNPTSASWTPAGSLMVARSGHAATVLRDGRVMFAGGSASYGPSFDIEIYDPATGTSVHAGDMTLARVDHAAATLGDGRVLIVGGSDGVSPLSVAEVFDPATGQSAIVAVGMSTPRARATATTLLDGHVLIAGGTDGTNDLSSAEIFDPPTESFFTTGPLQTARSGHVAILLPNNNQVLIAGGTSGPAAVASAELYADWKDGFSPTPNPMSTARAGGIAGGLKPYDLAFVGGGGATTAEYYGYATVKTDREDYWPGEPVTVTGSGWQPGETVTLTISEDADTHFDFIYSAVADTDGRITNAEFAPIENEVFHHFGKTFYVAARGAASEALNTFTDGNGTINGTVRNSVTSAPIAGATITCLGTGPNPCNGLTTATSNASGAYAMTFNFSGGSATVNITVSAPGYTSQTQSLQFANNTRTIDWNLVPSISATALSLAPAAGTYGGSTSAALTATLTSGGSGVSGETISFTLNGTSVGSATTSASGVATLASPSSLSGINAGSYPAGVAASFAGDASYSGQTASSALTVSKAQLSVKADDKTKPYDGATFSGFTSTISGFVSGETESGVRASGALTGAAAYTGAATTAVNANVTPYAITPTIGSLAATNYDFAFVNGSLTIGNRAITVTADAKTKTYGDADPALTYQVTSGSLVTGDTLSGSLTRMAGNSVGIYAIQQGTLAAGANYTLTYVGANLTIGQKAASVTPNAAGKTYGDVDPTLTGTLVGFLAADNVTATYSRTAGETVGAYVISATLAPVSVLGNYDITSNTASFNIAKKSASVTPNAAGKTYGDVDPTLTGTLVGFLAADNVTATYARTAGETFGAYVISATLAPVSVLGNYDITSNTASFNIAKKAASVTPNAAGKTYGAADPVLTGTLVGFLSADNVTATYSRTPGETAGMYVISASLAPVGVLGNYNITSNTANFTVAKAVLTVTAVDKTKLLNAANPPLTASYSGFANSDTPASAVTGTPSLVTTAVTNSPVGSYPITASTGTLTATNYSFVFAHGTLSVHYLWDGFLQPINDTAHDLGSMSRFKLGQTVPAKFDLKDVNGVAVLQSVSPIFNFALIGASCGASEPDSIDLVYPASTQPVYTLNGGHYQFNWSTKGLVGGYYRIFAKLNDGTTQSVDICLAK